MPKLISLKFSEEEMPSLYSPGECDDLGVQDFVVAERENSTDVGFVAAIEYVSSAQLELRRQSYRKVVRRASPEEKEAYFVRKAMERKALALCKARAREANLPIKVTRSRIDPFDGRVIFQFTSDTRIDFRALVRELSLMLRSRVELWQIGVRDEARLVDGFGVCGLRTCCSTWLPDFRTIGIRMAKDQDISLPPSKLSGVCGRLLCCLSYEVDQYRAMSKGLKPKGATVTVEGREGIIIDRNIMLQTYVVRFPDGTSVRVRSDDMAEIRVPDQMKRMAGVFQGSEDTGEVIEGERPAPPPAPRRRGRPEAGAPPPPPQPRQPEQDQPPSAEAGDEDAATRRRRRSRRSRRGAAEGTNSPDQQQPADDDGAPRPPRAEGAPREGRSARRGRDRDRRERQAQAPRDPQPPQEGGQPAEGGGEGGGDRTSRSRRRGGRGRRRGGKQGGGDGPAE